jgi:hypothetical protein
MSIPDENGYPGGLRASAVTISSQHLLLMRLWQVATRFDRVYSPLSDPASTSTDATASSGRVAAIL